MCGLLRLWKTLKSSSAPDKVWSGTKVEAFPSRSCELTTKEDPVPIVKGARANERDPNSYCIEEVAASDSLT